MNLTLRVFLLGWRLLNSNQSPQKICVLCGEDCSDAPRVKDDQDRYYHEACFLKNQEAAEPEPAPPAPPQAAPAGLTLGSAHRDRPSVVEMAQKRYRAAPRPVGKDWLITYLLAFFLGGLGIDRFYTGKIWLGVGKLLTCGGCGLWGLIDVILLLTENYQDVQGNCLQPAKPVHKTIAIVLLVIGILLNIIYFWFSFRAAGDSFGQF